MEQYVVVGKGNASAGPGAGGQKAVSSSAKSDLKKNENPKPTILSYPLDVGSNPRQASYILFARHSISGAKVNPPVTPVMIQTGPPNRVDQVATAAKQRNADSAAGKGGAGKDGSTNSLTLAKRNISQTGNFIALYMPPAVNVGYAMDYSEGEIGVMGEALYGLFKDYQAGVATEDMVTKAAGTMGQGLEKMGVATIDKILPGAKDLYAIEHGSIITPRTEMMFRGIGRRSFSFSFTFIPKEQNEVTVVHSIVNEFKTGMTPRFKTAGSVREMTIPDVFSIEYMHINGPNQYINKIGKCYLKTMDVTYGGDKFVTYNWDGKGAPPQRTTINLAFQELEIMDRDSIERGF